MCIRDRIQAVGFTLGMGAGNYISRSLGAKNEDIAVRTAATAFFTAIGIGVVMAVTGLSFLDRLVRLLGATETIAPYARDYEMCIRDRGNEASADVQDSRGTRDLKASGRRYPSRRLRTLQRQLIVEEQTWT